MSDDFDPTTVPIQAAATVMMVRDAADGDPGIEVFMLRRTVRATFAAGMYVFPGGRVDDIDHADEIAPFCRGLDDVTASQRLGIPSGGLAYWVASVRECFEEAGVLLAESRNGGPLALDNDDRHAVHDGSLSMVDLCRRDDLVLDLSTTHYVDHWITPVGENRRFDTRFFVTEAPADQEGLHDDKETVESLWVRPQRALQMFEAGELMMLPPTIANVKALVPHLSAHAAVLAGGKKTDIPCILPKIRIDPDGKMIGIALPTDPDYPDLP
jgi:8-oxo-dGTP pyrophosphatase MutT (NUDIX family)